MLAPQASARLPLADDRERDSGSTFHRRAGRRNDCRESCASPRPSCSKEPIRQGDEFSPRRLSVTENERRSRAFGATNSPGCAAWPSSRRRPRRCPGGHDVSDDLLVPRLRRRYRGGVGVMTTVEANGVTLGVEDFGDAAAPLVLCAGGTTMLSWPDTLCESLARGGRHVVRYDLRDSGASITVDPEAPAYTLRDLAADAAALARELDDRPAHLAGIGVGGMVAQVAALDHPDAFSALTLAGTRPIAPGPVDDDLPDHDAATMGRL